LQPVISETITRHDPVVGLFIDRDELGRAIEPGTHSTGTPSNNARHAAIMARLADARGTRAGT
jgi:hypothetical protein